MAQITTTSRTFEVAQTIDDIIGFIKFGTLFIIVSEKVEIPSEFGESARFRYEDIYLNPNHIILMK